MQVQDRQNKISAELHSFFDMAKDADIKCTELVRKTASENLKAALEQKKTEISGGPYGDLFDTVFVAAESLVVDNEVLSNLGRVGKQRINEKNQKICDLDLKYQQASENLDKFEFDTLVMVLTTLGNSGLERALDYCSSDKKFMSQRR
ncbi:MAG: hypothetical protein ACYC6W_11360 [Nitrosotalea sp.]